MSSPTNFVNGKNNEKKSKKATKKKKDESKEDTCPIFLKSKSDVGRAALLLLEGF